MASGRGAPSTLKGSRSSRSLERGHMAHVIGKQSERLSLISPALNFIFIHCVCGREGQDGRGTVRRKEANRKEPVRNLQVSGLAAISPGPPSPFSTA